MKLEAVTQEMCQEERDLVLENPASETRLNRPQTVRTWSIMATMSEDPQGGNEIDDLRLT